MANIIRAALNATGQAAYLFTGGMSKAGINISGTFVGTIAFSYANLTAVGESAAVGGGVNFNPLFMWPFPPGVGGANVTPVSQATAPGSWEILVKNIIAIRAVATLTSGTALIQMGASLDSSYQDVFLASTSINVTQKVSAGATNVVTQGAQANRAWRLRTLSVAFNVAAAAGVDLQISDGASSLLWEGTVPPNAGSALAGGGTFLVPLPADENTPGITGGGLTGTPGNSMIVTLAAPGGAVISTLNAEFHPC